MQICTVQWNIGGAYVREASDDPTIATKYTHLDVRYVVDVLRIYTPDIVTLQEAHANVSVSQAHHIAQALGLSYVVSDAYADSHIEQSQKLCQAILSRWPIVKHTFSLFHNPHYSTVSEDGSVWVSHDKGVTTVELNVVGRALTVQTLHLIPFRKFDLRIEDAEGQKVVTSVAAHLDKTAGPYLLQGDFNYEDLRTLLPAAALYDLTEADGSVVTTPKGRIYDHVLFRGMKLADAPFVARDVRTDHYPVVCCFVIG